MAEVRSFAVCVACGTAIAKWRERLVPAKGGALVLTDRGELAVRVREPGACMACGGDIVEIRVEETR